MASQELSLFKKLQTVRCEVNKKCTKKTGKNQYFSYFQLEDFLGVANEEFKNVGLTPIFTIEYVAMATSQTQSETINTTIIENKEMAFLRIFNDEGQAISFQVPTANAKLNSNNPIQELGAKMTYLKRYLYMNALELSEGDIVDASHEEKTEAKATEKQIELIKQLGQEKKAWLKGYLAKNNLKSLGELSVKQASEVIGMLKNE